MLGWGAGPSVQGPKQNGPYSEAGRLVPPSSASPLVFPLLKNLHFPERTGLAQPVYLMKHKACNRQATLMNSSFHSLKGAPALLALAVINHLLTSSLIAATITVTSSQDAGTGSLRQAIQNAAPGDTINLSVAGTRSSTWAASSGLRTCLRSSTYCNRTPFIMHRSSRRTSWERLGAVMSVSCSARLSSPHSPAPLSCPPAQRPSSR